MRDLFRSCDFLNIPTSLSYKKEYFYATNVGAFLTIIFFLIIVIMSTYEIIILYDKSSFTLISNQYTDLSQTLNFSETPFLFQLINDKGQFIDLDDKLYSLEVYTIEQTIKIDDNGKKKKKITNTKLEIEKCDKIFSNESEYFSELNLSKYFCIKNESNLTAYGLLADMTYGFRGFRIYINKCNKEDCYNNSVINKKLHNSKFIVTYLSLSSNIFNLNDRNLKYQLFTKSITISTGILKKIFFTFDKGTFDLFNSIIFNDKITFNYIIGSGYSMDVDLDPTTTIQNNAFTLSYISFHYSGNIVETRKEVQNILDTISIIGNTFNIILTIFKVINSYYSNKILFVDIFRTIFFGQENMNINNKENNHLNNNFKTFNKNNISNKKNNLDLSEEISISNNFNKNNNKKSSSNKIILESNKNTIIKRKSKLYKENEGIFTNNKIIYFYLFPLWFLRRNKSFNNIYLIKEKICSYFSIEKINELIKFKEILDDKSKKSKINYTEFIHINSNNCHNNCFNSMINKKNSIIK